MAKFKNRVRNLKYNVFNRWIKMQENYEIIKENVSEEAE